MNEVHSDSRKGDISQERLVGMLVEVSRNPDLKPVRLFPQAPPTGWDIPPPTE